MSVSGIKNDTDGIDSTLYDVWSKYDLLFKKLCVLRESRRQCSSVVDREARERELCTVFVNSVLDEQRPARKALVEVTHMITSVVMNECADTGRFTLRDMRELRTHYLFMLYLLPEKWKGEVNRRLRKYCGRRTSTPYENYVSLKAAVTEAVVQLVDAVFSRLASVFQWRPVTGGADNVV